MKKIALSFMLLALGACEYTQQLCDVAHRVDVAGFEKPLTLVIPDDQFNVHKEKVQFKRLDTGRYDNGGFSCQFGSKVFLESQNDFGNWTSFLLVESPVSFVVTGLAFDRRQLDSFKIPYRIERRRANPLLPLLFQLPHTSEETTDHLVVDNSALDPALLVDLLIPASQSMHFYK
jgi:hypothetical protein